MSEPITSRVTRKVSALRLVIATAVGLSCISSFAAEGDVQAKLDLGRKVFTKIAEPQCGICHTLKDAGTSGTIGANLEELQPNAARVAEAVRKGLGVMPPYGGKLTEEQIKAVAEYVARATSGK